MIPRELKRKIEKYYSDNPKIMSYLNKEDVNNLYLCLFDDYSNIQAIPNSTVLYYLRRKDLGSNLDIHNDLDTLYKIAQDNKEKISIFIEFENFFKDDENFV